MKKVHLKGIMEISAWLLFKTLIHRHHLSRQAKNAPQHTLSSAVKFPQYKATLSLTKVPIRSQRSVMMRNSTTSGGNGNENSKSSNTALVIGITNLLVGVIAIVGNLLLCWTIYRDPFRRLRTTASYLVVNLAIADLLTGLITEPFYAAFEISNFMEKETDILYVIGESTAYVFVNASILSILSLAWDRYIAVRYPLLHSQKIDRKRILTMIVLLWIYSILFSMLRFMGVPEDVFYWLDLHVNYTLFGGLLIGLYISIFLTIRNQLEMSLRAQGFNSEIRRQPTHDEIETKVKSEKKMTKIVFLLLLVAIACMLPLYIMLHVELLCESCMEVPDERSSASSQNRFCFWIQVWTRFFTLGQFQNTAKLWKKYFVTYGAWDRRKVKTNKENATSALRVLRVYFLFIIKW